MTNEEILFKIMDHPLWIIPQFAFMFAVGLFFALGCKFFWAATKFIYWYVDRQKQFDLESEEYTESMKHRQEELQAMMAGKVYKPEDFVKGVRKGTI